MHSARDEGSAQQGPQAAVGLGCSLAEAMPHLGCQVNLHVWGIYPSSGAVDAES